MSGALIYDFSQLQELQSRVKRLDSKTGLINVIGAIVETQTRRRIQSEKKAPDGSPWKAWSSKYAARRPSGKTLLMSDDHLLGSITFSPVGADALEVGSNMIYAATQQHGDTGRNIAARAYLGISGANEKELISAVDHFLLNRLDVGL